ncbi:hypothetical protein BD779DRAFT_1671320 [Infundibulicybe gibba]|nr:hypothetical protein BD779DRAFT_1671320 [Infundibulicybe gibba]
MPYPNQYAMYGMYPPHPGHVGQYFQPPLYPGTPGLHHPPPTQFMEPPPNLPGPQPHRYQLERPPTTIPTANSAKPKPNAEPRPGVFMFQVEVISDETKREFTTETDTSWDTFRTSVLDHLEGSTRAPRLAYKVSGDGSKASPLENAKDFATAMERVCYKAGNARTRAVSLEIKNLAKGPPSSRKFKKRSRADDVPPDADEESGPQLKAYKQLEQQIKCELHQGHCFVDRPAGYDNHRRLSHAEMTLWAKMIAIGKATIYNPPHCLSFDRGPAKKPRRSPSVGGPTIPELHVTIQNINPASGDLTAGSSSWTARAAVVPPSDIIQSESATGQNTPLPTGNAPLTSTDHPSPIPTIVHFPASPSPPPFSQLWDSFNQYSNKGESGPGHIPQIQPSAPSHMTHIPYPIQPSFPHIQEVLQLVDENKPGEDFWELKELLLNAGLFSSEQILMLPEDVLGVIVGLPQARVLRNYARHLVLPILGVHCNHDEPEISPEQSPVPDKAKSTDNNKRWTHHDGLGGRRLADDEEISDNELDELDEEQNWDL